MRRMLFGSLFSTAVLVAALLGLAIGFLLGRYLAARPFRHQVRDYGASETLGAMLNPDERALAALAFKDQATAVGNMSQYSYAVPNVPTPFLGSGPRPGQNNNAWINQMQFRSEREVATPKPPGIYRIFLVGGSTAFGSGAPSQDTIVGAYLERRLVEEMSSLSGRSCEVFTMANPSWTSAHERIVIENRLSELEPDMVISLSGGNDVHWAGAGQDINWFRTYADQHVWELLNAARKLGGMDPMPEVVAKASPVAPARVGARLEKNVRLGALALALEGAAYVFVLQPGLAVTSKPLSERERALRAALPSSALENFYHCYRELRQRLEQMSYPNFLYLDKSDAFSSLSVTDEIFLDSYHFGDRGNEVLAHAIADGIKELVVRPA
ncbi:MAG: hypothetical protein ABIO87_02715 [Chthoniobacterales bacterium]